MPSRCSSDLWKSIYEVLLKYKKQQNMEWKAVLEKFEKIY